MAVRCLFRGARVLALLAFALAPPAQAGNVLYNFNSGSGGWFVTSESLTPPEKPWTWIQGPSVNEGGWQAWRGADAFQSASYLVSPLLVVDDVDGKYVRMDIRHRFDFGGTGTTPLLALGQVQYQINNGGWLGIRTQDFGTTSGKIPPAYPNPPYPFIDQTLAPPTGTYAVDAWNGTTLNFSTGFHIDSGFELLFEPDGPYTFGPGDLVQFRFLVATQTPLSGTGAPVIDWEINRIQIDGVDPAGVPEPGTLVLAGIGGLGCLLVARRRRRLGARAGPRTPAGLTAAFVLAIACGTSVSSARADAIWNFQLTSGSWTKSMVGPWTPPANQWMYTGTMSLPLPPAITGGTSPHWHITGQGVTTTTRSAYYLTSPTVSGIVDTGTGAAPATQARISIAHNYLLKMGVSGTPIETGLLEYQLNSSGTWVGLPLSAFTNGGSVLIDDPLFGASPFKPLFPGDPLRFVNQTAYVAATYLTPTGTAALPFVAPGAAAFTGTTSGWSNSYVPSQAFLNGSTGLPAPGISTLQLRFVNANLASGCDGTEGWNIRYVEVNFLNDEPIPPVPEPAALALGGTAFASLAAAAALRRLTTSPRGRA